MPSQIGLTVERSADCACWFFVFICYRYNFSDTKDLWAKDITSWVWPNDAGGQFWQVINERQWCQYMFRVELLEVDRNFFIQCLSSLANQQLGVLWFLLPTTVCFCIYKWAKEDRSVTVWHVGGGLPQATPSAPAKSLEHTIARKCWLRRRLFHTEVYKEKAWTGNFPRFDPLTIFAAFQIGFNFGFSDGIPPYLFHIRDTRGMSWNLHPLPMFRPETHQNLAERRIFINTKRDWQLEIFWETPHPFSNDPIHFDAKMKDKRIIVFNEVFKCELLGVK